MDIIVHAEIQKLKTTIKNNISSVRGQEGAGHLLTLLKDFQARLDELVSTGVMNKPPMSAVRPPASPPKPKPKLQNLIDEQIDWYLSNKDDQQRWGSDDRRKLNRDYSKLLAKLDENKSK